MTDENAQAEEWPNTVVKADSGYDGLTQQEKDEVDAMKAHLFGNKHDIDPDERTVGAKEFREMARFCNQMANDLAQLFISFQDKFKTSAMAYINMAELLEKDAKAIKLAEKAERRAQKSPPPVTNVFNGEDPTKPT